MPEPLHFLHWQDVVGLLAVVVLLYGLLRILKGTVALKILVGLMVLLAALSFTRWIGFHSLNLLAPGFWAQIFLALLILFHPEIRRALARIGQVPFAHSLNEAKESRVIDEIIRAVLAMAATRTGAILVLERGVELKDTVDMGIALDAKISKELLLTIFHPASLLHDGAVIVKGDRIAAAGCFLPLALGAEADPLLGTRHRAALGVTRESDAVVIVVSEEAGTVSVIMDGRMEQVDSATVRKLLTDIFMRRERQRGQGVFSRWLKGWVPVRFKAGPRREPWQREETIK